MTDNTQAPGSASALVLHLVEHMLLGAEKFNREIIGLPIPTIPTMLSKPRQDWALGALNEELTELGKAFDEGNILEASDALVDFIYFALGRLVEMGVPPRLVFDEVQRANMDKERGELSKRPGSLGFDAIKPAGWQEPNHAMILHADLNILHNGLKWGQMSPVLRKVVELRAKKSADYNSGPKLDDYFPFGHLSYAQMLHVKMLRVHSLLAVMSQGGRPNFEGLSDSIEDLINYATFYGEALAAGTIDTNYLGAIAK